MDDLTWKDLNENQIENDMWDILECTILLEKIWTKTRLKMTCEVWDFAKKYHEIIVSKMAFEEWHAGVRIEFKIVDLNETEIEVIDCDKAVWEKDFEISFIM